MCVCVLEFSRREPLVCQKGNNTEKKGQPLFVDLGNEEEEEEVVVDGRKLEGALVFERLFTVI